VSEYYQRTGRALAEGIIFILNGNMERRKWYIAEQTDVNLTYSVT
jgi:hypothetical protein